MRDNFPERLHERLAEAQAQQAKLKRQSVGGHGINGQTIWPWAQQAKLQRQSTEWLIVNAVIGTIQAIIHDWEECQPLQYESTRQRKRVEKRARTFAASVAAEIYVKGGEEDARLIVARLAEAGIRAAVEQRGEQWFVRKKGESE